MAQSSTSSVLGLRSFIALAVLVTTVSADPDPVIITSSQLAGIIIGCLIGGALFASIIFLFTFFRTKQKQYSGEDGDRSTQQKRRSIFREDIAGQEKLGRSASLLDYQPQCAEEDTINGEMLKLRDRIRGHAQGYYHHGAVKPGSVDEENLHGLSQATGMTTGELKKMLLNPDTRGFAISLYVGWVILSRCGGGQVHSEESLLPPEVARFEGLMANSNSYDAGQIALVSKWKSISGALIMPLYRGESVETDPRGNSIEEAITVIDLVLEPFISTAAEPTQRTRNLEGAMRRAAQFALLLYSQPSSWKFDWSSTSGAIVFPSLLQTVNNDAQCLLPPRIFTEAEMIESESEPPF